MATKRILAKDVSPGDRIASNPLYPTLFDADAGKVVTEVENYGHFVDIWAGDDLLGAFGSDGGAPDLTVFVNR